MTQHPCHVHHSMSVSRLSSGKDAHHDCAKRHKTLDSLLQAVETTTLRLLQWRKVEEGV